MHAHELHPDLLLYLSLAHCKCDVQGGFLRIALGYISESISRKNFFDYKSDKDKMAGNYFQVS